MSKRRLDEGTEGRDDVFQVSRLIHQILMEQARYPANLIRTEINQMREQLGVGTAHYTFVHFCPEKIPAA